VTDPALLGASRRELAARMADGHPFDPAALVGHTYRGVSLGLPAWLERLTWKTFAKAFHRDPTTGAIRGHNVRLIQDGVDGRWRARERAGVPETFGPFAVVVAGGQVVLDYAGAGLLGALRDPLVALRPGSAALLLGRSRLALGGASIATPSFFVLERAPT
jgi:hypothetical protein